VVARAGADVGRVAVFAAECSLFVHAAVDVDIIITNQNGVHDAVRRIPARILHAPRYWPEYCVDYYAFFFKDSEGIEYEVASFARDVYFPV